MITGEIRRFLRDDGMVKVSRSLKENGYKISKAKELLARELGREPELMEIAALTELSVEEIVMAMDANREVESLYQPVAGMDGDELLLIDKLGSRGEGGGQQEDAVLNRLLVEQLLEGLDGQERAIIKLRYYENRTHCETAKLLSMTQVQVSRKERKILGKLRGRLR